MFWNITVKYLKVGNYPVSQGSRTLDSRPQLWQMLTDFQNSFTFRLRYDCVTY